MGRKSVKRGLQRSPVSISLPEKLIIQMDEVLGDKLSRSRYIEKLIITSMKGKQSSLKLVEHVWACPCGHEWRTNNPSTTFAVCRRCKGIEAVYLGEWEGNLDE